MRKSFLIILKVSVLDLGVKATDAPTEKCPINKEAMFLVGRVVVCTCMTVLVLDFHWRVNGPKHCIFVWFGPSVFHLVVFVISGCQCPRCITKTCLYSFDPLKLHFYILKLGFPGVNISFLFSVQKHRLWILVRTASPRRF